MRRFSSPLLLLSVMLAATTGGLIVSLFKLNRANVTAATLAARIEAFRPASGHEHSDIRLWMIRQQLSRIGPVIVLGDSITEAAPLPDSICGHKVVNAGVGGANARFSAETVSSLLAGVSPALIVIAVGTNDAHSMPNRAAVFGETYLDLLKQAKKLAPSVSVVNIPPIKPGDVTRGGEFDINLVGELNEQIATLATHFNVDVIDVHSAIDREVKAPTIDGVHLSYRAYNVWLTEIKNGIRKSIVCN